MAEHVLSSEVLAGIPPEYHTASNSAWTEGPYPGYEHRDIPCIHLGRVWKRMVLAQHPKLTTTAKMVYLSLLSLAHCREGESGLALSTRIQHSCLSQIVGQGWPAIRYAIILLIELRLLMVMASDGSEDLREDGHIYIFRPEELFRLSRHAQDGVDLPSICNKHDEYERTGV